MAKKEQVNSSEGWAKVIDEMGKERRERAQKYPEYTKLMNQPYNIVLEFFDWLQKTYPSMPVRDLGRDLTVCEFFKIDLDNLNEELEAMNEERKQKEDEHLDNLNKELDVMEKEPR